MSHKQTLIFIILISTSLGWEHSNTIFYNFINESNAEDIKFEISNALSKHLNYNPNAENVGLPQMLDEILFTSFENCVSSFTAVPEEKKIQIILERIIHSNFDSIFKNNNIEKKMFRNVFRDFNVFYFKNLFADVEDSNAEDLNQIVFPVNTISDAVSNQDKTNIYEEDYEHIVEEIVKIQKDILEEALPLYEDLIAIRQASADSVLNFLNEWVDKIIGLENLDEGEKMTNLMNKSTLNKMKILLNSFPFFFTSQDSSTLDSIDSFARTIISKRENFNLNHSNFFEDLLQICFDLYAVRDERLALHQGIKLFVHYYLPGTKKIRNRRNNLLNYLPVVNYHKTFNLNSPNNYDLSNVQKRKVQLMVMDYLRFLAQKDELETDDIQFVEVQTIFKQLDHYKDFQVERLTILDKNDELFVTDLSQKYMIQKICYQDLYATLVVAISEINPSDVSKLLERGDFAIYFNSFLDVAKVGIISSSDYAMNLEQFYVAFKIINFWQNRKKFELNKLNLVFPVSKVYTTNNQIKMDIFNKNLELDFFLTVMAAETGNKNNNSDLTFLMGQNFTADVLKGFFRKFARKFDLLLI